MINGGMKMNRELKGEIVKRFGSQWAFAHEIGLQESIVSLVVRGHKKLDENTKLHWAEKLGADVCTLFGKGMDNV